MPSTTMPSAMRPPYTSSSPTCGLTNSVRRSVTPDPALSAASTCSLCWAEVTPFCTGRRDHHVARGASSAPPRRDSSSAATLSRTLPDVGGLRVGHLHDGGAARTPPTGAGRA